MKSVWLFVLACFAGVSFRALAETVFAHAVQVSAAVPTNPSRITLSWEADPAATGHLVVRKSRDSISWGPSTSLGANVTTWTDTNVTPGSAYEYGIARQTASFFGYGYIYSGIETPLIEFRGKVILLVESSSAAALGPELVRLHQDLVGDGWTVLRHDVSRFDSVTNIKALIKADYDSDPVNVQSVFLFGHVPVPYSGNLAPDGHSEHRGAWPADVYYGDMDGTWTDSSVNAAGPSDPRNRNVPGDGKFDQTSLPSDVELQVGRVDLSNLPAFTKSETELLRQYLNKNHSFRHKLISAAPRGLVDDELGLLGGEVPAVNGWRNFAPLCGPTNTFSGDWLTTLSTQSYLWGYGCGGGNFTVCSGVATSAQLAASDPRVIFTMFFGSYFGDWDSENNFLRAAIATPNYTLTSAWVARPYWQFHHMALGEPIGFSVRLSQNNLGTYETGAAWRYVHIALMGDPTLRMHVVPPPAALVVTTNGSGGVELDWNASPDAVVGYYVYRAPTVGGPYIRLNGSLLNSTRYTDPVVTTNVYMVRAVKLEVGGSGSYYNASQGVFQDLAGSYGPPALRIGKLGNGVSLSWSATSLGYQLEATASFPPTNWLSVSNTVQTNNGANTVFMDLNGSNQFFRLRRP